jgi:hypothetical protein
VSCILEELPESPDETYERILTEINRASREHLFRILHCLAVSIHPLRVEELAEVLAVDFKSRGIPKLNPGWQWEDNEEAVTVVVNGESRMVHFSYFSVK